ncbi:hypothetical protein L6164_034244 [Bauhinia variegata]|uniref:Uncharacterized protein n=1 Tax=Bauhinia variegata TaxID=167791 RepID=A0ACB9KUM0_BAUVA|nr:hypothetical protein L6164_034244 [Bauhinia variegata]
MPSKAKKNPKTQSRLSSPHQPPLTPTLNADSQVNEEELRLCLEEASRKFPSLIGKSAFIGAVSDVKTTISGCTIWLSPSAMVSSSLVPGSSVSVSIASSSKKSSQSHGFPLKSLANECARCYGLDTGKRLDDEAGNYFAVATVLSSSKVLKNDVLLCSSLFHTMGRPTSGTIMFVYAIHSIECEELYLELVPSENDLPKKINTPSRLNFSAVKAHVQSENEAIASPRTPSFVSKFSNAGDSTSPIFEDSVSSISKQNNQSVASFDVKGALGDESAKRLLQTCATSSLCSRLY